MIGVNNKKPHASFINKLNVLIFLLETFPRARHFIYKVMLLFLQNISPFPIGKNHKHNSL